MTAVAELPRAALDQPLGELFERAAARYPERAALAGRGGHVWSYAALDAASNRLARALLTRGNGAPARIALLFAHDAPVIGAMLAALKAGSCYVPLDPHHSPARMAGILRDCEPALLVCDREHLEVAHEVAPAGCEVLDAGDLAAAPPADPPRIAVSARAPAAICYSSGSTGEPKGIVWDHRGITHRAMLLTAAAQLTPADRVALPQSVAVGASFRRIFGPLLAGACVVPFDVRAEPADALVQWLADEEITVCGLAASVFRHFAGRLAGGERFPALKQVWLASEAVLPSDVELFRARFPSTCRLGTGLSTSEAGSLCELDIGPDVVFEGPGIPVGYPVVDKEVLLVDDAGRQVGPGEVGEIAVRSEFLAIGYWRRPDIDARVFRPDPAGGAARICHTGDLGRFRPDGCLLYVGRKDTRAKLRGRFVDTQEIEAALLGHSQLAGAAVSIREDRPGDQRLVAYVVARGAAAPPVGELQRFVRDRLGEHLVPSRFVILEAMPRTPNGKVDRGALPAPDRARPPLATPRAMPCTPVEETVARIWAEALGLDAVGIHDNFLELGGTSLVASRITSSVIERFGIGIPLRTLLAAPTAADMAAGVVAHLLGALAPDAGRSFLASVEADAGDTPARLDDLADRAS